VLESGASHAGSGEKYINVCEAMPRDGLGRALPLLLTAWPTLPTVDLKPVKLSLLAGVDIDPRDDISYIKVRFSHTRFASIVEVTVAQLIMRRPSPRGMIYARYVFHAQASAA
jgi:hypothetical protein